jgi:hypothetical protein
MYLRRAGNLARTETTWLAMLRQDRDVAGEFFDQMCVCAVHDRPFITRYTKQPSGKFRATQCVKVQVGSDSGRGGIGNRNRFLPTDRRNLPWLDR